MFRDLADLDRALDDIRAAPRDTGTLQLIARRIAPEQRETVARAELDVSVGLVGDRWCTKPSKRTPDGSPHPEQQLTLMSIRAIRALADPDRWALAGDQLYVDFDLSEDNLPPGTRVAIGDTEVVIMPMPHLGCATFTARFGTDATKWVNSDTGKQLRLRGVNARVLTPGIIVRGDRVHKA
jgi:hypothetical protein